MRIAWSSLVLVASACGGHGSGGIGNSASATMQRTAQGECAKAYDCMSSFPTDLGFSFQDIFQTSESACVSFFVQQIDPAGVQAAVDAGRIVYDPVDADICLDFAEGLSCPDFWAGFRDTGGPARPPECDTAFMGTVSNGGACSVDLECVLQSCDDTTMTCS